MVTSSSKSTSLALAPEDDSLFVTSLLLPLLLATELLLPGLFTSVSDFPILAASSEVAGLSFDVMVSNMRDCENQKKCLLLKTRGNMEP